MARPLRIQFPNAWYHVMNRGKRGENIFIDKGNYDAFIALLKDCAERNRYAGNMISMRKICPTPRICCLRLKPDSVFRMQLTLTLLRIT